MVIPETSFCFAWLTALHSTQRCRDVRVRVKHEPHGEDDPTKIVHGSTRDGERDMKTGTYRTFMNCATEHTLTPSNPQGRGKQTHDEVDPKMERVGRVESRASN